MTMTVRIAIIGSGVAGLATALALLSEKDDDPTQRGGGHCQYQIELWDASSPADYFDTSAGAAVQITPNGMTALHALSAKVCRAVLQEASHVQSNAMIVPSQRTLYDTLQPLPSDPPSAFPTVMIRWGVFRQLLVNAVMSSSCNSISGGGGQQCHFKLQRKVTGFRHVQSAEMTAVFTEQQQQQQQVCLEYTSSDNSNKARMVSDPYSLVIAADGKASIFRPTPIEASSPRVNFKAVVQHPTTSHILPNMAHTTYAWLSSFPCFVGPAGVEGWLYWGLAVPSEMALQMDHRNSQKKQLMHLLSHQHQQQATAEQECQIFLDLVAATPETAIYQQESTQAAIPAHLVVAPNVVLVGDAAHAMNSSYGQATSFALEDAVTLAHCLRSTESSLADRLDDYSRRRVHRCLEMQQKSQQRLAMTMKGQDTRHITQWIHRFLVPGRRAQQEVQKEESEEKEVDARASVDVSTAKPEDDEEDHMITVVA